MFQYIRLADNTNVDLILHNLFENHWHMMVPHTPSLVITIIGGAKNFQLDGKKKDIFNHGLVNVRNFEALHNKIEVVRKFLYFSLL